MRKLIDRFAAKDADGNDYTVLIHQDFIDVTSKSGPGLLPGLKAATLSDGRPLNRVDDTTYTIVASGQQIKKIA